MDTATLISVDILSAGENSFVFCMDVYNLDVLYSHHVLMLIFCVASLTGTNLVLQYEGVLPLRKMEWITEFLI